MSILGGNKLLVSAVSTWNNKGIKQAEKSVSGFHKSLVGLGKTLGLTFSAAALISFGKASVDAFATNEKQVAILTNSMKNLGQTYAAASTVRFIDQLALASGVTKEQLIPAFQQLDISIGDAVKSQAMLKLAMDVSAGTGKDLGLVTTALSKGYMGNTTALTRLGAGLSKALLKTGDMEKITAQLSQTFQGSAEVAANSFSGTMNRLSISVDEAKIKIGKELVDAFILLAGQGGIGGAQSSIDIFSTKIANAIKEVAHLTDAMKKLLSINHAVVSAIAAIGIALQIAVPELRAAGLAIEVAVVGFESIKKAFDWLSGAGAKLGSGKPYNPSIDKAAQVAAMAEQNRQAKINKAKLDTANKILANDKKAAALKIALSKGQAVFDIDKIQVIAALMRTNDEESKRRLLLMQALQGDDADLIMQRLKELAMFSSNEDLRKLAGLKALTAEQLAALNTTLANELDTIAAVRKAQQEADDEKQKALEKYLATLGGMKLMATSQAVIALPGGGGFFGGNSGGGFTPPTNIPSNQPGTSSPWMGPNDYPATAAELAAMQFGSGGSTVIAPTVLPVILTDTQGFSSAIQQQLQILTRDGMPTAGNSGLINQFL